MKESDFFLLFLVIVFGVAGGNLFSNWVTARFAAYELERATEQMAVELKEQNARNAQLRQLEEQKAEERKNKAAAESAAAAEWNHQQWRAVRGTSRTAAELKRLCEESRQTNNAADAGKACRNYEQYLDTGVWGP